jgi:hypothetical protein
MGARLMWLPPIEGLSVGGSIQRLRLEFEFTPTAEQIAQYQMMGLVADDFAGTIAARLPAWLWVASVEYQIGDLLIAAEYTESRARYEINLALPCTGGQSSSRGGYASVSHRVLPWLSPGAYFSAQVPDPCSRVGPAKYQYDAAGTLRFDLNEHWLFKVEGHFMSGTAQVDPALNDNEPRNELPSKWGLFLLKTTAYF